MSPPRVGGSASKPVTPSKVEAPVTPKPAEVKPAEKKAPADSGFADAAKKKPVNMTGRHKPVAKAPVPVKKELHADVAKLRAAVHAGSTAKPKLDPEVKGALERIKLVSYKGKDAIGDVLKELEPSVAKEVFKNLPSSVRAEIGMSTPFGFQPVSVRMAQVQNLSDAQLQEIGQQMRAGLVEDLGLQLAVSTELAARSQWGKDNPEIVEYQRQAVVDGKVNFASGRGAGRTETSGEITMNAELSKSPEALAALLAHEATHSYHTANGGMDKSVYAEETAGNLASAQVWAELGNPNDTNLSKNQLDGLNEYAQLYKSAGEDGVQARVAAEYASEASKTFEATKHKSEKKKVLDVVDNLAKDPNAVKAMTGSHAYEVTIALMRVGPTEDQVKALGATFKNLKPSEKLELIKQLKDMDKDARETLVKGMS